jgi:hypothetical protein
MAFVTPIGASKCGAIYASKVGAFGRVSTTPWNAYAIADMDGWWKEENWNTGAHLYWNAGTSIGQWYQGYHERARIVLRASKTGVKVPEWARVILNWKTTEAQVSFVLRCYRVTPTWNWPKTEWNIWNSGVFESEVTVNYSTSYSVLILPIDPAVWWSAAPRYYMLVSNRETDGPKPDGPPAGAPWERERIYNDHPIDVYPSTIQWGIGTAPANYWP